MVRMFRAKFGVSSRGGTQGRLLQLFLCAAMALVADMCVPQDALSQAADSAGAPVRRLQVVRYKSRTFTLQTPFASAVVGSPDIADVLPISDRVLYVQGKKAGATNVSIFGVDKRLIGVIDIEVTVDTQAIAERIKANLGAPGIRVSSSHEQIVLSGEAANSVQAEHAVEIAKSVSPETNVINLMHIASSQQVMLKVRFLEVSRNTERDLGVNIFGANKAGTSGVNTGQSAATSNVASGLPLLQTVGTLASGSTNVPFGTAIASLRGNVDLMITALETKGLVRQLAEPDLVALSGDTASFFAGGEIPIPVSVPNSGSNTITVEYKPFGVQLTFQPTVLASGVINLRLTPTVSELDKTNSIEAAGYRIPALKKREARTTIELGDGQSFAIAGLLQSEGLRDVEQVPWLGSLPVLGALFRSSAYQQNETDLVVIVTPHIVAPIAPGQVIASPLNSHLPSNDIDFFLMGQTEVPKKYTHYLTSGGGLAGPYGHIVPLTNK